MAILVKMKKKDVLALINEVESTGLKANIHISVAHKGWATCKIDASKDDIKRLNHLLRRKQTIIDFYEDKESYMSPSEWQNSCL